MYTKKLLHRDASRHIDHLYKSKESLSVCLCVSASNISADQDQTNLKISAWLLLGSVACNVAVVWTAMVL